MISVTMQFPNVDAAVSFFQARQTISPAVINPPTGDVPPASQAVEGPAATATRRGRPPKAEKKVETPQPEVGQNTGSGSPELNPSPDLATGAGTPQGDVAQASPASAKAEVGAGTQTPATLDDTRKAMLAVTEKLGTDAGMKKLNEILVEKAGVKLLRDLPAEKYQVVIEACVKAVE